MVLKVWFQPRKIDAAQGLWFGGIGWGAERMGE